MCRTLTNSADGGSTNSCRWKILSGSYAKAIVSITTKGSARAAFVWTVEKGKASRRARFVGYKENRVV